MDTNYEIATAPSGVRVTAVSKLRHAELHALVKKLGSQAALAEKLGVSQRDIGRWCGLKACPPASPTRSWTKKRLKKLEKDLFELTNKTLEELFPAQLRDNTAFLNSPKTFERTREVKFEAMKALATNYAERTTVDPEKIVRHKELVVALDAALKSLSDREQDIVISRYGILGAEVKTTEELAKRYKLSRARVNQIEHRALGKLQDAGVGLAGFSDRPQEEVPAVVEEEVEVEEEDYDAEAEADAEFELLEAESDWKYYGPTSQQQRKQRLFRLALERIRWQGKPSLSADNRPAYVGQGRCRDVFWSAIKDYTPDMEGHPASHLMRRHRKRLYGWVPEDAEFCDKLQRCHSQSVTGDHRGEDFLEAFEVRMRNLAAVYKLTYSPPVAAQT